MMVPAITNNTNINVNAGAGSFVNVEVVNANGFGAPLFPTGPLNLFGGDSPYLYPALMPGFLGAPRVDLGNFAPAPYAPQHGPQPGMNAPHKSHHCGHNAADEASITGV